MIPNQVLVVFPFSMEKDYRDDFEKAKKELELRGYKAIGFLPYSSFMENEKPSMAKLKTLGVYIPCMVCSCAVCFPKGHNEDDITYIMYTFAKRFDFPIMDVKV